LAKGRNRIPIRTQVTVTLSFSEWLTLKRISSQVFGKSSVLSKYTAKINANKQIVNRARLMLQL
jgi:hypothetical protein